MDRIVRIVVRQSGRLMLDEKFAGYWDFERSMYESKEEILENNLVITKYYKKEGLQDESHQPT